MLNRSPIICSRLLNHFCQYVDAIHILSSTSISREDLVRARELLDTFVRDFEEEYGAGNVVFNIHLLSHLADCVEKNGPLFCYSNYSFEDNMGHLLSFVSGTNDVILQIASKYVMERNLLHNLINSPIPKKFYDAIQASQKFPFPKKAEIVR